MAQVMEPKVRNPSIADGSSPVLLELQRGRSRPAPCTREHKVCVDPLHFCPFTQAFESVPHERHHSLLTVLRFEEGRPTTNQVHGAPPKAHDFPTPHSRADGEHDD